MLLYNLHFKEVVGAVALAGSVHCCWFSRMPDGLTDPRCPHAGWLKAAETKKSVKKKKKKSFPFERLQEENQPFQQLAARGLLS